MGDESDFDYTPEERSLLLIREQILATAQETQDAVTAIYDQILGIVQSTGDAGILALALLCAEIDNELVNA